MRTVRKVVFGVMAAVVALSAAVVVPADQAHAASNAVTSNNLGDLFVLNSLFGNPYSSNGLLAPSYGTVPLGNLLILDQLFGNGSTRTGSSGSILGNTSLLGRMMILNQLFNTNGLFGFGYAAVPAPTMTAPSQIPGQQPVYGQNSSSTNPQDNTGTYQQSPSQGAVPMNAPTGYVPAVAAPVASYGYGYGLGMGNLGQLFILDRLFGTGTSGLFGTQTTAAASTASRTLPKKTTTINAPQSTINAPNSTVTTATSATSTTTP